jgi:glycosyltransferase involved in cell wall biosynthesis
MIIMVYSSFNAASIENKLGAPEYSYWFVRKAFWPALERFGIVVPVTDPKREVDTICRTAARDGQTCVFFSFEPPHKTMLGLGCPTIPVFAWEFDSLPDAVWEDEPRNNWPDVLRQVTAAITHSSFSRQVVRNRMGENYPVWSIPAPMYGAHVRHVASARGWHAARTLTISGIAIDAALVDLEQFSLRNAHGEGTDALRALAAYVAEPERAPRQLALAGVVYTAIFNPIDGRKNWNDLIAGFIWEFRDTPDATLLLKITHADPVRALLLILLDIAKMGTFRCRIVLIHGMLPDVEYQALVEMTSYTVNASTNEGQCLPLMEFMSAGRPAIAPLHTAMLDYITPDNAFIVKSTPRPAAWPHDPRGTKRTTGHMLSFADLLRAYRDSYEVAKHQPARYASMSAAATASLAAFCGDDVVHRNLAEVLDYVTQPANQMEEGAGRDAA